MGFSVRQVIDSKCISVDDDPAAQAFDDYGLITQAITVAAGTDLTYIDNPFANAFPGDHYRLLAGLLTALRPKAIVDIGTHYGTGTRVMCDFAPKAKIDTFDLLAWDNFETTYLTEQDFSEADGQVTQHLFDLSDPEVFKKYTAMLEQADFIMVDAPKNGKFEEEFFTLLSTISMKAKTRYMLLDDIRFTSELVSWRRIQNPKIDLTSFGHFSGTGLVDISDGFKFLS